jgi:DNA-binding PadR family transcriptional regulator
LTAGGFGVTISTVDISLTPAAFQILLGLTEGERHGYALLQQIEADTEGRMRLGPGTLYRTLRDLLEQGLVTEKQDERRRYYRLTARGLRAVEGETERLETLARAGRRKLAARGA